MTDELDNWEPVDIPEPHVMDIALVIGVVGGGVILSLVLSYWGLAWLLGVL